MGGLAGIWLQSNPAAKMTDSVPMAATEARAIVEHTKEVMATRERIVARSRVPGINASIRKAAEVRTGCCIVKPLSITLVEIYKGKGFTVNDERTRICW